MSAKGSNENAKPKLCILSRAVCSVGKIFACGTQLQIHKGSVENELPFANGIVVIVLILKLCKILIRNCLLDLTISMIVVYYAIIYGLFSLFLDLQNLGGTLIHIFMQQLRISAEASSARLYCG